MAPSLQAAVKPCAFRAFGPKARGERCSNGLFLSDPNSSSVNRLFSWTGRVRLATALALSLAGVALPNRSWARFPQIDSATLLTLEPTSLARCPQFCANGTPPAVTRRPQLRELCYEAFAVLHSGTAKTPRMWPNGRIGICWKASTRNGPTQKKSPRHPR